MKVFNSFDEMFNAQSGLKSDISVFNKQYGEFEVPLSKFNFPVFKEKMESNGDDTVLCYSVELCDDFKDRLILNGVDFDDTPLLLYMKVKNVVLKGENGEDVLPEDAACFFGWCNVSKAYYDVDIWDNFGNTVSRVIDNRCAERGCFKCTINHLTGGEHGDSFNDMVYMMDYETEGTPIEKVRDEYFAKVEVYAALVG